MARLAYRASHHHAVSIGAVWVPSASGSSAIRRRRVSSFAALGFGVTSAPLRPPPMSPLLVSPASRGPAAFCSLLCARPRSSCIARVPTGDASWRSGSSSIWAPPPSAASLTGWSSGRVVLVQHSCRLGGVLAAAILAAFVHTPSHPDVARAHGPCRVTGWAMDRAEPAGTSHSRAQGDGINLRVSKCARSKAQLRPATAGQSQFDLNAVWPRRQGSLRDSAALRVLARLTAPLDFSASINGGQKTKLSANDSVSCAIRARVNGKQGSPAVIGG